MSAHKKKAVTPFAPSCVILRNADGKLEVLALSESADPALLAREAFRKSKGRNDHGRLIVTDVLPIIRGKSTRQLHFA
jgi:hypothetical protein